MTERQERALQYFNSGDNCAQAVFKAYCDLAGLTEQQAALASVGFGGGMVMVMGALDDGDGASAERRAEVYARVQRAHRMFIERLGTINCAELLQREQKPEAPTPEARTPEYYAGRPCTRIVLTACGIIEDMLAEKQA